MGSIPFPRAVARPNRGPFCPNCGHNASASVRAKPFPGCKVRVRRCDQCGETYRTVEWAVTPYIAGAVHSPESMNLLRERQSLLDRIGAIDLALAGRKAS